MIFRVETKCDSIVEQIVANATVQTKTYQE